MPKTKWAGYSVAARFTIATGRNVSLRHLKIKNQRIYLLKRKKERKTTTTTTNMGCALKRQINQTYFLLPHVL